MNEITQKWINIEQGRNVEPKLIYSQYVLNYYQYKSHESNEIEFGLGKSQDKEISDKAAPPNEISRRNKIRSERYYLKLLINGKIVCKSQNYNLRWPDFELLFQEKI